MEVKLNAVHSSYFWRLTKPFRGFRGKTKQSSSLHEAKISIDALLLYEGEQFIRQAYQLLLDREPDAHALQNGLQHLQQGANKLELLQHLRYSSEGSLQPARVAGLEQRLAMTRKKRRESNSQKVQQTI